MTYWFDTFFGRKKNFTIIQMNGNCIFAIFLLLLLTCQEVDAFCLWMFFSLYSLYVIYRVDNHKSSNYYWPDEKFWWLYMLWKKTTSSFRNPNTQTLKVFEGFLIETAMESMQNDFWRAFTSIHHTSYTTWLKNFKLKFMQSSKYCIICISAYLTHAIHYWLLWMTNLKQLKCDFVTYTEEQALEKRQKG